MCSRRSKFPVLLLQAVPEVLLKRSGASSLLLLHRFLARILLLTMASSTCLSTTAAATAKSAEAAPPLAAAKPPTPRVVLRESLDFSRSRNSEASRVRKKNWRRSQMAANLKWILDQYFSSCHGQGLWQRPTKAWKRNLTDHTAFSVAGKSWAGTEYHC